MLESKMNKKIINELPSIVFSVVFFSKIDVMLKRNKMINSVDIIQVNVDPCSFISFLNVSS